MLQRGIAFPRTHALRVLNELLSGADRVALTDEELNSLSEWAVESRYPGPWPEATTDEAERAKDQAEQILLFVKARI